MVYIFKDRLIRVEWTIYKGISPVKEDFSRSNVKVFLLGNREKYLLQARADKGTLYVDIPSGLEEGTYSIEAIWVKNMDHVFDTRSVCRSKKEDLFSITEFEDEATNIGEGVVVLKVKTSTATYGYDGLSSYELAVLRGDWNGTEGEWLKHERYVSVLDSRGDSEVDTMSQKAITDELETQDNAIEDIRKDTEKLGDRVEEAEEKVNNMGDVVDEIKSHAPVSARPAGFKPDIDLTPEITVDRAWRDHEGNVIRDTYITRRGLRNEIIDITNQQVTDLKPGSVDPDDLSEATKQLIGNKSITNLPDEEDITVTDNQTLKLKDKEYAPKDYSGMGRVYLRKHYVNGVNTLTQHMMRKPNTIYIIQYDYCLAGQTIEVPENCVLDFQGGSFRNGTLVGTNTSINAGLNKIFNLDITINGTWNVLESYPEWFGAIGDGVSDDLKGIQKSIDSFPVTLIDQKTYYISSPLLLYRGRKIAGISAPYYGTSVGNCRIKSADNAILLSGYKSGAFSSSIKFNHIIENIDFTSDNKDKIAISTENESIYCASNIFKELVIRNFRIGIKFDVIDGDNTSSSNVGENIFDRIVVLYSSIGFLFLAKNKDKSGDANFSWFNVNTFNKCVFTKCSNVAIVIDGFNSIQNNVFNECNPQDIGNEYDEDLYNLYGCHAFYFRARTGGNNNTMNIIKSNYIEGVRSVKNGITNDEFYKNSVFCLKNCSVIVKDSLIYSFYTVYNVQSSCIISKDNYIENVLKKGPEGEYHKWQYNLINYTVPVSANYFFIDIDENRIRQNSTGVITSCIGFTEESIIDNLSLLRVRNRGYYGEPFNFDSEKFVNQSIIYVDEINGNDSYLGYTKSTAVRTLKRAISICGAYGKTAYNNINLLSNINVDSQVVIENGINCKIGIIGNSYKIKVNKAGSLVFGNDLNCTNCVFEVLEGGKLYFYGNTFFKTCIFNINKRCAYTISSCDVIFDRCTFNSEIQTDMFDPAISNVIPPKIYLRACTSNKVNISDYIFLKGNTLPYINPREESSGALFYDTEYHNWFFTDGKTTSSWKNIEGTLKNKVIII